ncbi:MAG TPA: HAD-IIA family hydrolase [Acidimicrobiales bacterium]|nr:HAD-IIA family hydrolase [Acidimicrobiales bacterium]
MTSQSQSGPETWVVDLDGVVWLANEPIHGAAEAIRQLRESGRRVAFFTNNSFALRNDMLKKFAAHGIECASEDLMSSSQAAAGLMKAGERAMVLGGPGIVEALEAAGVEVVPTELDPAVPRPDAVVVGLDLTLSMPRLTAATRAIAAGARLIGTNDDATYPTPDGALPGGGSMLAAVQYATRAQAVVAGKPYPPAAELIREKLGPVAVMVGDRPETDGALAVRLGARYALVRSGVTPPGVAVDDPKPDLDAADLAALVAGVLDGAREVRK